MPDALIFSKKALLAESPPLNHRYTPSLFQQSSILERVTRTLHKYAKGYRLIHQKPFKPRRAQQPGEPALSREPERFISIPEAVAGPEPAMPPPNLLSLV